MEQEVEVWREQCRIATRWAVFTDPWCGGTLFLFHLLEVGASATRWRSIAFVIPGPTRSEISDPPEPLGEEGSRLKYRFRLSVVPESRQPIPSPNSWWYLLPRPPVSGPPGVRNGGRSADSRRPWRTSRTFETVFDCHTLHTPESNRATRPSFCVECLFQSTRKIAPLTHANVLKTTPSCERAKFVS